MWNKIKDFGPEKLAGWIYRQVLTYPFHRRKLFYVIFILFGIILLAIIQHFCILQLKISDENLSLLFSTSAQILVTLFAVLVVFKVIKNEEWNKIADTIIYIFLLTMFVLVLNILANLITKWNITLATVFFVITSTAYSFYLLIRFAQGQVDTNIKS